MIQYNLIVDHLERLRQAFAQERSSSAQCKDFWMMMMMMMMMMMITKF